MRFDEKKLSAVRALVDPGKRHPPEKLWAAMQWLGLEPEDLNPIQPVQVSGKIPDPERAEWLRQKREESLNSIRQDRVHKLQDLLGVIGDKEVNRLKHAGDGISVVRLEDLPDGEELGTSTMQQQAEERSQKQYARIQAEQERKATLLCTGFLTDKKKAEDADAKVHNMQMRLAGFQKERQEAAKAKAKEQAVAQEKRDQGIQRAMQERMDWENETLQKLEDKVSAANSRREKDIMEAQRERLAAKMAAADQKRRDALIRVAEDEFRAIDRIEEKRMAVEERLEESRALIAEEIHRRTMERQARFQDKQLNLINMREEWAEKRLKEHAGFVDKFQKAREAGKKEVLEKSKSTSDVMKRAQEKAKANNVKMAQDRLENFDVSINERHNRSVDRVKSHTALGFKGDTDVHSHCEAKSLLKDLQLMHRKEIKRKDDANMQAILVKLAEHRKRSVAIDRNTTDLQRRRQKVQKDSLTLADNALEGFMKIQTTSDEGRIKQVMTGLGFEMPSLPVESDGDEEQDKKQKAY